MPPMAAVVAMPEPDRAPKNIHASMDTQPRAPVRKSTRAEANSTIRLAMPPVEITDPASMKNGMAMTVKEKMPE